MHSKKYLTLKEHKMEYMDKRKIRVVDMVERVKRREPRMYSKKNEANKCSNGTQKNVCTLCTYYIKFLFVDVR